MAALRELLAAFSISVETGQLKQGMGLVETFRGGLGKLGAAVGAAFAVGKIKSFLSEQIAVAGEVNRTAAKLGVSAKELEKFEYVSGMGADEAGTALGFLNRSLGSAVTGSKESQDAFKKLGIDAAAFAKSGAPVTDLVARVADGFGHLGSQGEKTEMAMKIFGRGGADLLPFFAKGGDAVRALGKDFEHLGGGFSETFLNKAKEAGREMKRFKFAMSLAKSEIAVELLPFMTKVAHASAEWVAKFTALARSTTIVHSAVMLFGLGGAAAVLKLTMSLGKLFGVQGNVLTTFLKMGPILGILGALFLVADDLFALFSGKGSAIGDALTELYGAEKAKEIVDGLRASWQQVKDAFASSLPALKEIGELLIKGFAKALPFIAEIAAKATKLAAAFLQVIAAVAKGGETEEKDAGENAFARTVRKFGNGVFGSDKGGLTPVDITKTGGSKVPFGDVVVPTAKAGSYEEGQRKQDSNAGIANDAKSMSERLQKYAQAMLAGTPETNKTTLESLQRKAYNELVGINSAASIPTPMVQGSSWNPNNGTGGLTGGAAPTEINSTVNVNLSGTFSIQEVAEEAARKVKAGVQEANNQTFAAVNGGGK